MKLIIRSKDLESEPDIKNHIEYRIGFAFARTRQLIRSIFIATTDLNGPKGGIDKQCKVIVKPIASPDIVIIERQSEIRNAIDRGITRASRNLIQQVKRKGVLAKQRINHQSLPLHPDYS